MIKIVSLETAKLLKEAGFRQDTSNYHEVLLNGNSILTSHPLQYNENYASPTTDELLEELPDFIIRNNYRASLKILKDIGGFAVTYQSTREDVQMCCNESLCEALAQMWLCLKTQG